jgi:enediyne biosynthesis protein E4
MFGIQCHVELQSCNIMRLFTVLVLFSFLIRAAAGQSAPIHFHVANAELGLPSPGTTGTEKKYIVQQISGGVALFDCDNDGRLDLAFVNDSTIDHYRSGRGDLMLSLYHQEASGKFVEVTKTAGLTRTGWGMGVAVADYDNDGLLDIYVTGYNGNVLYRNTGNCKFEDVTTKAGVAMSGLCTGVAWGDYDRDGFVDLFVSRYIHTDVDKLGKIDTNYKGLQVEAPWNMHGDNDVLFHNRGDGTFEDVSKKSGVSDPEGRLGLTGMWGDLDNDGWPDLYALNDSEPNYLYHNKHDGTFEDIAILTGAGVNGEGRAMGSMGVNLGDFNHDGKIDIVVTTFAYEPIQLFQNKGDEGFTDITWSAKTGQPTFRPVKWGTGLVDFDSDGWLDIMIANGHLYTAIDTLPGEPQYREPLILMRGTPDGKFAEIANSAGLNDGPLQSRRGIAFGDINNDGAVDAVVFNQDGPPSIFLNDSKNANHRVLFKLIATQSNRAAIGARVTIRAGGIQQMDEVHGGNSYISQSDLRLHFGLGTVAKLDEVEVRWPNGKTDKFKDIAADKIYTIVEGSGIQSSVALPPVSQTK